MLGGVLTKPGIDGGYPVDSHGVENLALLRLATQGKSVPTA